MALKKEVAPQPYRMLMKVLNLAVSRTLYVGGGSGVHGLNTSMHKKTTVSTSVELIDRQTATFKL